MTYQIRLQKEPFEFYSEFDNAGESLIGANRRHGEVPAKITIKDDFIYWVQESLNTSQGSGLKLDGDIGGFDSNTRNAVRAFQRSKGLPQLSGGPICPDTERALGAAVKNSFPIKEVRGPEPLALTLYVNIPLQIPIGTAKSMTGIFVPENYCPLPQVDLIVYLHGFKRRTHDPSFSIDTYWSLPLFRLREEVNISQKNVILVAPTLGPNNEPGSLECPGGFDRFLERVVEALKLRGPYAGQQGTPSIRNIILACHSGSGNVMRAIAMGTDVSAAKIQECWAFEPSFMGDAGKWKPWAASHPNAKLYIYYISGQAGESLCRDLNPRGMSKRGQVACLSNIFAEQTNVVHDAVPMTYFKDRIQGASFLVAKSNCPSKPTRGKTSTDLKKSFEVTDTLPAFGAAASTHPGASGCYGFATKHYDGINGRGVMSYRNGFEQGPFETYEGAFETFAGEAYPFETELYSAYEDFEGGAPVAGAGLAPAALNVALRANRVLARQIGWGCVVGGIVRPIPELGALLGLPAGATEAALAQAIARWQQTTLRQRGDGQLGPGTWAQMLRPGGPGRPVIPPLTFRRDSWPVFFGGTRLGVIEKTAPYEQCFFDAAGNCAATRAGNQSGGSKVQVGFRITDMEAVRRARFVEATTGAPHFNWVQVIETNRPLQPGPPDPSGVPTVQMIRKYRRYVDPTAIPRDNHPYYWDEPGDITQNVNRQARDGFFPNASRLCYDLIFWDSPSRPLAAAQPGLGVFWNAQLALVGIRTGNRNVTLNTVNWGFDIRPEAGGLVVRLNGLRGGPFGGSPLFRKVIAQEIRNGNFPGHCFGGLPGAAGCR